MEAVAEVDSLIYLADPTIFHHEGTYYLYGTVASDADQGFLVYTSSDMHNWSEPQGAKAGYALRKEDVYGDKGFWAPQVLRYRDKFYLAYTANEQIAIAQCDSPLGPFTQAAKDSLTASTKQIDPFIFIDDDGKIYLYHVRLTEGNRLFVAEMTDDLSAIKPGTLQECIAAVEPWENTAGAEWPVAEGPSVLKHHGLYYFVYSANDFRNPDYAVGFAVSKSPYGPWKKYGGNPILGRATLKENGPGHGDLFQDDRGHLHYVFHTHNSRSAVSPRKSAIVPVRFTQAQMDLDTVDVLTVDEEHFYYLKLGNSFDQRE